MTTQKYTQEQIDDVLRPGFEAEGYLISAQEIWAGEILDARYEIDGLKAALIHEVGKVQRERDNAVAELLELRKQRSTLIAERDAAIDESARKG